jgi:hypothetical protein
MFCSTTYKMMLFEMNIEALKKLTIDIRAQVNAGLMTHKEGHDRLNLVAIVMMTKEMEQRDGKGVLDEQQI